MTCKRLFSTVLLKQSSECDHVTELYKKVTDAITDTYIKEHQSDLIEAVCDGVNESEY